MTSRNEDTHEMSAIENNSITNNVTETDGTHIEFSRLNLQNQNYVPINHNDNEKQRKTGDGNCFACFRMCGHAISRFILFAFLASILGVIAYLLVTVKSIAARIDQNDGDTGLTCFDEYGCFPKLYGCIIPTVTVPMSPAELGVQFYLFTVKSNITYTADNIDDRHIEVSDFDPNLQTKIIVHGFKNGYKETNWMGRLKKLIMKNGKYNVIAVDWSKGANTAKYWKAAASTNVVAAIIAKFINKLAEIKEADVEKFHLIGHSLGAHISGAVGYHFPYPKINRITGLDPAGPCFFKYITTLRAESEYISMEDATIVETVHTNGQDLGFALFKKQLSHYEFYPNGGKRQPGCNSAFTYDSLGLAIKDGSAFAPLLSCSHAYAHELFAFDYGIYNTCRPVAYNCDNYQSYQTGNCHYDRTHSKAQIMAFGHQYSTEDFPVAVPEKPMKYYIDLSESEPYCMYQYVVYVQTSRMTDNTFGVLSVYMHGSFSTYVARFNSNFYSDQEYKSLVNTPAKTGQLGPISQISVRFESSNGFVAIEKVTIQYLNSLSRSSDYLCDPQSPKNIDKSNTTIFCTSVT